MIREAFFLPFVASTPHEGTKRMSDFKQVDHFKQSSGKPESTAPRLIAAQL
jgi:hypothetical protein